MDLKEYIASIPDYPQEGIIFRDISPLMADGEAYRYATQQIVEYAQEKGIDMVVGPEARLYRWLSSCLSIRCRLCPST